MASERPPVLNGRMSLFPLPDGSGQRPMFTSGDVSADRAVIFIGGLFSGMMDTPFVPSLSNALGDAGWRLVQFHWSGAYSGFGTGSLDRDADELETIVQHLREDGVRTVVLMGHSTGSNGVLHYLTTNAPKGEHRRARVQGGILVSPASDREFLQQHGDDEWKQGLALAEKLIAAGTPSHEIPLSGIRYSAYRLHSLVGVGGDDDYFSSDLPAEVDGVHKHPLVSSFGRLDVPALALWAEKDHCAVLPDQRVLLRRWAAASQGQLSWHVLDDATHCVEEEEAQDALNRHVVAFLRNVVDSDEP